MTTITLTPEQVASIVSQARGGPAPDTHPLYPGVIEDAGTLDKNGIPFTSVTYVAGTGFSVSFDVADDEVGAKTLTFGQSGTLGNATKTVTLEKDGVVIPVGQPLSRSASIVVNMGNPTAPNNLSPGRWLVRVLFQDAGAAVIVLG